MPRVLFDESHAQQFLIGQKGPLDLSKMADVFRAEGYQVDALSGPLSLEELSDTVVLVISGPFMSINDNEVQIIRTFVANGGGLAVMLHIAPPARSLLHELDVDYTNGTLREMQGLINDEPLNFLVTDLAEHPVTSGLERFSVYGSWALRGTAPHVSVVAQTSQHGWVDLDRNNELSNRDAVQTFGVAVAGELGQGRYVVFGDDALFQNQFLDPENQQLALQAIRWLSFR
jgi:hypothetical protein